MEDISKEEVFGQIIRLKKRKAPGEDFIQNEAWIHCSDQQLESLTEAINKISKGEGFPENWKNGIIVPIHKKGDRHLASNYRGITLLYSAFKIYASILAERLHEEAECKYIIPDN